MNKYIYVHNIFRFITYFKVIWFFIFFLIQVVEDKFFIIGKCIKCVFLNKEKITERQRRKKEFSNNSSFAEVAFSMETIKKLKAGDYNGVKCIRIKCDPSNFVKYFKTGNKKIKSQKRKIRNNNCVNRMPSLAENKDQVNN